MLFEEIEGFDWDAGNKEKNFIKHNVTTLECEEVFMNMPIIAEAYAVKDEERYIVLGITKVRRKLTIVFAIRGSKIRVISARPQSEKERKIYEKETER